MAEFVFIMLWTSVGAGFVLACWFTHDMGPASENGPIAAMTWLVWGVAAIITAVAHAVYIVVSWAIS